MRGIITGLIVLLLVIAAVAAGVAWVNQAEAPATDLVSGEQGFVESTTNIDGTIKLIEPAASAEPEALVESSSGAEVPTVAEPSSEIAPVATVRIAVDEFGFSPPEVTVEPNTAVVFVNNGQAPHWVKGEGFDSGKSLQTGEEFTHVFTEAGEWAYEDDVMPDLKGVVIVE